MKILMVVPSISKKWGGTTTSIVNFYNGLKRHSNVSCTVITTVTEIEKDEIGTEVLDNDDFILFSTKNFGWRQSKELKDFLKKNVKSYDLVWIHALWTGTTFYAAKYAKKYSIPYIVTPHGMLEPAALQRKVIKKKLYWYLVEKQTLEHARAIHCINRAEEVQVSKYVTTETFVLPNGVNVEEFQNKDYKNLEYIGFIGRLHEKKGLDLLLKAMKSFPSWKLLVAGSGTQEYEEYLHKLANDLNIQKNVNFLGFADEQVKKELFGKVAFVVVPSYTEVLTFVALESISHSTPVVITKECNFDDIEAFEAGIVIPDNNPSTIEKGIKSILENDLYKMSKNAYALAKSKYSIDEIANKMLLKMNDIIKLFKKE